MADPPGPSGRLENDRLMTQASGNAAPEAPPPAALPPPPSHLLTGVAVPAPPPPAANLLGAALAARAGPPPPPPPPASHVPGAGLGAAFAAPVRAPFDGVAAAAGPSSQQPPPARSRRLPASLQATAAGAAGAAEAAAAAAAHVSPEEAKAALVAALDGLASGPAAQAAAAGADPPPGSLSVALMPHQRTALAWMLAREREGAAPCGGILADEQGLGKTVEALALVASAPRAPPGAWDGAAAQAARGGRPVGGTLVVCVTSILKQWGQEIATKAPGLGQVAGGEVVTYHGSNRSGSPSSLAAAGLVLTTYGVVASEFKMGTSSAGTSRAGSADWEEGAGEVGGGEEGEGGGPPSRSPSPAPPPLRGRAGTSPPPPKRTRANTPDKDLDGPPGPPPPTAGPLFRVAWARVILDEGHAIRNVRTAAARACTALVARARWVASGTPIHNRVADLFGLWRFLRYEPYVRRGPFKSLIEDPVEAGQPAALARLRVALAAVTLRRTKESAGLMAAPATRPGSGGAEGGEASPGGRAGHAPTRPAAPPHPPGLPPRTTRTHLVTLSPAERATYDAMKSDARAQLVAGVLDSKGGMVRALCQLLRLRQVCDHPALAVRGGAARVLAAAAPALPGGGGGAALRGPPPVPPGEAAAAARLAPPLRAQLLAALDDGVAVCPVCGDVPEGPVIAVCGHAYCRQCAGLRFRLGVVDDDAAAAAAGDEDDKKPPGGPCIACGVPLAAVYGEDALRAACDDGGGGGGPGQPRLLPAPAAASAAAAALSSAATAGTRAAVPWTLPTTAGAAALSSSKLDAVWAMLAALHARNARASQAVDAPDIKPDKAIVFSQWTSALDLIDAGLALRKIPSVRVDGTMATAARAAAVESFQDWASGFDVITMSIKAAALGLNLTSANHVLIVDPWWAPAVEDQAADRAHRLGQTRPVTVTRFIADASMELLVLRLQERKRALVADALGAQGAGGPGAGAARARGGLTTEDIKFLFDLPTRRGGGSGGAG